MQHFFIILHHELRSLGRDRAFWGVALALTLLLCLACYNGRGVVEQQQTTLNTRKSEEARRLVELQQTLKTKKPSSSSHRDPTKPANVGSRLGKRWASLPPLAKAGVLAIGQSDLFPRSVAVTTRGKDTLAGVLETENPSHLLVGRFDPAFVLVYLLPLFLLALSYSLLTQERESGTLALLLCQSVSLTTLLSAKLVARFLALILPSAVLVVALCLLLGPGSLQPGELGLLLAAGVGVLLYGTFWILLCAYVNLKRQCSSSGNAAWLLGAWTVLTLVLPSVGSEVAPLLHPAPPRALLVEQSRAAALEATEHGSAILAQFYEDHPELAQAAQSKPSDPKDFAARRALVDQEVEAQLRPLLRTFEAQEKAQQAWVGKTRFLLPSVALLLTLSDAAGTGNPRQQWFESQVDRFHDTWKAWFLVKIARRDSMTPHDIDQLPLFVYQEEPLQNTQDRLRESLAGLLLPSLFLALWGALTLRFASHTRK